MTAPATQEIRTKFYLAWGDTDGAEELLLNHSEPATTVGNFRARIPIALPSSAANQTLNLASYCRAATYIAIVSRDANGCNINLTTDDTKFQIAGEGVFAFKNRNATPPTIYFDNPSSSEISYVDVIVLGTA